MPMYTFGTTARSIPGQSQTMGVSSFQISGINLLMACTGSARKSVLLGPVLQVEPVHMLVFAILARLEAQLR
jgi:hypothetical protein